MAKKSKGPRIAYGLKCTITNVINYIVDFNKTNFQTKTGGTLKDFKLMKYSPLLRKRTPHILVPKLK